MLEEVKKAKSKISKENIDKKVCLDPKILKEAVDCLRGAVMIAYPAYHNLPVWEPARQILEDKADFESMQSDTYEVMK